MYPFCSTKVRLNKQHITCLLIFSLWANLANHLVAVAYLIGECESDLIQVSARKQAYLQKLQYLGCRLGFQGQFPRAAGWDSPLFWLLVHQPVFRNKQTSHCWENAHFPCRQYSHCSPAHGSETAGLCPWLASFPGPQPNNISQGFSVTYTF